MGKVCAVIVAAGRGTRMRADINKQFLNIKDKPILYYTLKAFENSSSIDEIILVTAKTEIEYCKAEIVDKYKISKISAIVEGGKERQHSVYNGLNACTDCDVVLIHDGARPFVDDRIIEEGIKLANEHGACTCGVAPKDTIKIKAENGFSSTTLTRESLFIVQTPQCFKYQLILESHKEAFKDNIKVTDDTSIAEYCGHKVFLYEGSYNNIKITTPEDLVIGEKMLDKLSIDLI
ncbi:2-C-methyl-D-erythritol 4-phosphate cytidylyltransferase [Clostridium swellfunianum]|uniref:2-C-methyl-D-erythritol 4-phosphate cytidylyltransferase n=1 Tax=Clostridium swellfunianum TaxID=1367462 RepID=UPI00202E66EA|nr:2-C-methyl-D-erythritol 4-phosphate cytidylyltransferase [Clostridium swellfunianum]MCM0650355.1 2-C-methyl-D-erythritol 4-phosphate cytidylyltransferase [Clostridium swellfunianum]